MDYPGDIRKQRKEGLIMAADYPTLVAWDHRYLWHPFTQMRGFCAEELLVIDRGEGVYLFDQQGRRYLDGVSSLWTIVHGHGRPEINGAIREQLERLAHSTLLGLAHAPAIELAERLAAVTPPGLTRVFYSDSGSTAVEVALKMAYQYWQLRGERSRTKFLKLREAYHGDTLGAVSVGGIDLFHETFRDLLFPTYTAPNCYCYRCPDLDNCDRQCLKKLEEAARAHRTELAAIIIEPVMQGAAGMIPQPPGFVAGVRQVADECGTLLIADEVATGFGRTGTLFACEQERVSPDLMCLAKGITGGYLPLAATLATEAVYEAFLGEYQEFKTFFHGHTYTGNPLAAAAACASLEIFEKDRVLEQLQPKIAYLSDRLGELDDHPHVGDIRQRGFMAGIELVRDKGAKEPFPTARRTGHRVILEARKLGAILRPLGDVLVLMPPLSITGEELGVLLDITAAALDRGTRE